MDAQVQALEGEVPTVGQVRARIERAGDRAMGMGLRSCLLLCARVSEVVGYSSPGEGSEARGPKGSDAKRELTKVGTKEYKALVVDVRTAKRKGMLRRVGLAADFDPWVPQVADYFYERGEEVAFDFSQRALREYVSSNRLFDGWLWQVDDYLIGEEGTWSKVPGHMKRFSIHSLRDVRATTLLSFYGFDGADLAIHGGWTVNRAVTGISQVMARYLKFYEQWERPFPKLLKALPASPSGA